MLTFIRWNFLICYSLTRLSECLSCTLLIQYYRSTCSPPVHFITSCPHLSVLLHLTIPHLVLFVLTCSLSLSSFPSTSYLPPPLTHPCPCFIPSHPPPRWKSPVTPGDQLIMEMSLVSFDERLGFATMTGKAYVGGRVRRFSHRKILFLIFFFRICFYLIISIVSTE